MPHANLMTILYYTAPRQRGEPLHIFPLLARYSSVRAQISARNQGGGGGETHPGAAPKAAAQTLRTPSLRRARRGAGNIPPPSRPPPSGHVRALRAGRDGRERPARSFSGGDGAVRGAAEPHPSPLSPAGSCSAPGTPLCAPAALRVPSPAPCLPGLLLRSPLSANPHKSPRAPHPAPGAELKGWRSLGQHPSALKPCSPPRAPAQITAVSRGWSRLRLIHGHARRIKGQDFFFFFFNRCIWSYSQDCAVCELESKSGACNTLRVKLDFADTCFYFHVDSQLLQPFESSRGVYKGTDHYFYDRLRYWK